MKYSFFSAFHGPFCLRLLFVCFLTLCSIFFHLSSHYFNFCFCYKRQLRKPLFFFILDYSVDNIEESYSCSNSMIMVRNSYEIIIQRIGSYEYGTFF